MVDAQSIGESWIRHWSHVMLILLGLFVGVGEDEFTTEQQLQRRLKICHVKVTIHDCDKSDKVVAFIMLPPSPLSRSTEPLYSGNIHQDPLKNYLTWHV